MVEITVASDNFQALLNAEEGEEVRIGVVRGGYKCQAEVVLTKVMNDTKPREMTIEQIEAALGHKVRIVGGRP